MTPSTPAPLPPSTSVGVSTLAAAIMVALTVAAKSSRDALFCAHFAGAELPKVMVAGAALSALLATMGARAFRSWGPARSVPLLLVLNALGFVAEHAGFAFAPRAVSLVLYLHVSAVTGIVLSGFWSVVNERFDPHTLRVSIARIGLGGTVGGIVGGIVAERVATWAGARQTLLALAALSAGAALAVRLIGAPVAPQPTSSVSEAPVSPSPYLRELAGFVALTAAASSVIDFAFKMRATERFASADDLVHFFAIFYTATSVVAFAVQALVTPPILQRAGLAVGLAGLPLMVAAAGIGALAWPGLWAQTLVRGADGALSTTLFRSAYEPLYTPLSEQRKRSVKALIDVVINRLGDGLGSLLCWVFVWLAPRAAASSATAVAVVLAIATLFVVNRLRNGYVAELAASLRSGAVVLHDTELEDHTTRLTVSRTMNDLDMDRLRAQVQRLRSEELARRAAAAQEPVAGAPRLATVGAAPSGGGAHHDRTTAGVVSDLTSGDARRIDRALAGADPTLASLIIPLVEDRHVGAHAMKVLSAFGARVTDQLADALLDRQHFSPTVRRRLVRVMADSQSAWAATPLIAALDDHDFEARLQIVKSLDDLAEHGVALELPRDRAVAIALEELAAAQGRSAEERIEHVLRLLGLVFDREAFRLARTALMSDDDKLKGTGLEYLENVLPEPVRRALLAALAAKSVRQPGRRERDLLDELRRTLR